MSIDKKKSPFHLSMIIRIPNGHNDRGLTRMLNRPHPVFVSLPIYHRLDDPLLLCDPIPPSMTEVSNKYNESLQESASLMFKALKPFMKQYITSTRECFSIALLKDEVKRLEKMLQRHPQRYDAKLKIINLRRQIKQCEKDMKKE